ncbi:MAG: alpha/beta hydrolase [Acidobacteriota bacterium]|nr:MAG: alpha/beta hydrolase [Acidobacteriota bacterium]
MRLANLILFALTLMALQEPIGSYFRSSDGLRIHYTVAGEGSPVILIPGYTGTAADWLEEDGLGRALAQDHRVVAIDKRGHGASDKPLDPKKYGPHMVRDVVELMDHLGIEKAHVHGFSLGGVLVTFLLAAHPERFVTASYGGMGIPEIDPVWKARVPKDIKFVDPREKELFTWDERTDLDWDALKAIFESPWEAGEGFEGYEKTAATQIDLTKIHIPVLAVIGEYDFPNHWTHRMKRELANFKLVVLPDRAHLRSLGEDYNSAVSAFIDENDSLR